MRLPAPQRSLRGFVAAALLGSVALAGTGCLGGGAAAPPRPHCSRAAAAVPAPAAASARPVAVAYLSALAGHRYDRAQAFAHACSVTGQHSLDRLWLWLASMPTQEIRVADASVTEPQPGAVTVRATLFARFGPAPYSAWVTLGPKTLRLTPGHGGWRVRA